MQLGLTDANITVLEDVFIGKNSKNKKTKVKNCTNKGIQV